MYYIFFKRVCMEFLARSSPYEATLWNGQLDSLLLCNWRSKVPFNGLIEINDLTLTLKKKKKKKKKKGEYWVPLFRLDYWMDIFMRQTRTIVNWIKLLRLDTLVLFFTGTPPYFCLVYPCHRSTFNPWCGLFNTVVKDLFWKTNKYSGNCPSFSQARRPTQITHSWHSHYRNYKAYRHIPM